MTAEKLEKSIAELRSRPLRLLCRTRRGKEKIMTLRECMETGNSYVHIAVGDLNALLAEALGE